MAVSRSEAAQNAAAGLFILGGGAVFVSIPTIVIGAFRVWQLVPAGVAYLVGGVLTLLAAIRLNRDPGSRLAWPVVTGLFTLTILRFVFLPGRMPLSLIESMLVLLSVVSIVQLLAVATSIEPSQTDPTPDPPGSVQN
jgi:hypothetical protein